MLSTFTSTLHLNLIQWNINNGRGNHNILEKRVPLATVNQCLRKVCNEENNKMFLHMYLCLYFESCVCRQKNLFVLSLFPVSMGEMKLTIAKKLQLYSFTLPFFMRAKLIYLLNILLRDLYQCESRVSV